MVSVMVTAEERALVNQSAASSSIADDYSRRSLLYAYAARFPQKAPTTKWAYVPQALALLPSDTSCLDECLACAFGAAEGTRSKTRLSAAEVERFAYGRGIPLRILLVLFRWARAYSRTRPEEGFQRRFYNGTVRLPFDDSIGTGRSRQPGLVSQSLGQASETSMRSAREAVRTLRRLGLVHVVSDPGGPNFYIPHAAGPYARVPQYLWQKMTMHAVGANSEPALDGGSLLLLLALSARTHVPLEELVGRDRLPHDLSDLANHARFVHDYDVVDLLPFSPNKRREALGKLEALQIVQVVRTQGKRFIVLIE